jgi:hypothetical protein
VGVGAVALASAAIAVPAFGDPGARQPEAVTCKVHPRAHELAIRAHELRLHPRLPTSLEISDLPRGIRHDIRRELHRTFRVEPELTIERRIDEITVIDESQNPFDVGPFYGDEEPGAIRSCGEPPLVDAIDRVAIDVGRHTEAADLKLDFRYGAFGPGLTDEGDGGSEIELAAHLGEGYAEVEMTRGPDSVAVSRTSPAGRSPIRVNLNAGEPSPDRDLLVGGRSFVILEAAGGDDRLASAGGPRNPEREPVLLAGGQGDDEFAGGPGTEFFSDGPGTDRFDAGPGRDAVFALGRAPDRIDCGPGLDVALVVSRRSRVRHCEEVLDPRDLESSAAEISIGFPKALRRAPLRGRARALLSRLTRSR